MAGAAAILDCDAELMLRVKEGDGASFALLLEKHRAPVIHFLYRMVQNHAVAEELAQEVFLRVYRSRATYEPTAKFTTWLFRIATHLALNSLRDGKNERGQERLDDDLRTCRPGRFPTGGRRWSSAWCTRPAWTKSGGRSPRCRRSSGRRC